MRKVLTCISPGETTVVHPQTLAQALEKSGGVALFCGAVLCGDMGLHAKVASARGICVGSDRMGIADILHSELK